ncbi:MAG TPA: hypothetical protein VEQ87_07030 [Burkholderiales bacterium]|nr:hypothetical protein [Burkholderiales bacterium]
MLSWALRFTLAAVLAALVAHSEVTPAGAVLVAKIAVVVLLALCTVSLVAAWRRGRTN